MARRELIAVGCGVLILLTAEALLSNPRILFGRFLWFDELQIKLITAQSGVWHSITMIAHSGDETPPIYYLMARGSWWVAALMGGNAETGFRGLAFLAIWVTLLLTYAVLRRSFTAVPALIAMDLAYVAAGRFDAFWERGLNSWDIAAGELLVREAGGFVTGADGEPNYLETGSICCGNETMHRELLGLLRGVS